MPAKKVIATRSKTANNGDVPGVHRRFYNGNDYWTAKTRHSEKIREKKFSVTKYGEAEARRLAMEVAIAWLDEAGFQEMTKPGPTRSEVEQIEKDIRIRFRESAPSGKSGFAGFKELDMYGIGRIESNALGKCGVWNVVLVRRGTRYKKTFYDHSHGGRDAGLQAAKDFRDEILRVIPPLKKRELHEKVPVNNTSGVVGVRPIHSRSGECISWVAALCNDGKTQTKRFSVDRYGHERAYLLAVDARNAMVADVHGYRAPSPVLKVWIASLPPE